MMAVVLARARGGADDGAVGRRELGGGARRHSGFNNCGEGGSTSCSLSRFFGWLRSRSLSLGGWWRRIRRGAIVGNKGRLRTNRPFGTLQSTKSLNSKERLRVGNWIMQKLYDYAVEKTVKL